MNTFRAFAVAAIVSVLAACSTSPSKTAAPAAAPAPPPPPAAASLTGVWTVTIESQMGSQDSKLTLNQAGQALTGVLEAAPPVGTAQIKGTVIGADVKMSFGINAQGMELTIDLVGTQENGSTMTGKAVFGSFGEGAFKAKKQ